MKKHVRNISGMLVLCGVTAFFGGCGEGNQNSTYNPDTGHPAAWAAAESHGDIMLSMTNGFASCQECHGADFSGGISAVPCFTCHGVQAPHPRTPWRGGAITHIDTNPDNAPVCALCHSGQSPTPAPQGTAPGCFNNTLCHATPAGHPAGWSGADAHGSSAKTQSNGFSLCRSCHGADFSGGTTQTSCFSCHGVNAPHSPAPWRGGTRTHTSTNPGNASVCALCHSGQSPTPAPQGTPPGCFNNTLCHATAAGHPAGWSDPAQHGLNAEQDFAACKVCHGPAYKGGSATTTCYQCHNGPGLDHPAPGWVVLSHKTAALADNTVCKTCHGADYLGGGSHVACKSCHMENQTKVHQLNWYPDVQLNHRAYAKTNGTTSCSNASCHGTNLTGVALSGPSCSSCHTWPFSSASCGTCHAAPPSGTAFPNIAGRHSAHTGLSSTVACATCHQGAGSGTALHINDVADVAIGATYNAKSGAAAFSSSSAACSNVSCHGGRATPSWLTGAINVNTQCTSCHASGTTQYNSYNSGEHSKHVSRFACTVCHDTTKLAVNHFTSLGTTAMEGPASATIVNAANYNGNSCNPSAGGLSGCHSSENW